MEKIPKYLNVITAARESLDEISAAARELPYEANIAKFKRNLTLRIK